MERIQGEVTRSEAADESAERDEVEERHELRAVLVRRVVVDHREGRGDFRGRADPEHREEDRREERPRRRGRRRSDARDEQEHGRGRDEVREHEDSFPADPVAQRAEVSDGRDLRERIHGEQEAFPERVPRIREHHVLHDRDAREGRGAHHERRAVQGGEIAQVPGPEAEHVRQLAGQIAGHRNVLARVGPRRAGRARVRRRTRLRPLYLCGAILPEGTLNRRCEIQGETLK